MKGTPVLKKNDVLTVDIEDITDLGFGVARYGGMVIFVQDTVPADRAQIKIIKVNSQYAISRLEKLITPSPIRVYDRCSEPKCRACAYKAINYSSEAELKENAVRRLFTPLGIKTLPVLKSVSTERYRNKAQYPISLVGGEYKIGYFAPKTHNVYSIQDCALTPAIFSQIIDICKLYFAKYNISVYNEESGEGLLRHVYLRRGEVSGEVLLCLVINGDEIPAPEELIKSVTDVCPDIVGVLLNVNREDTNVILGDKFITFFGRDYIFDTLCDTRLKITAPAFYQVNHDTAQLLYREAERMAELKSTDTLLDLYCGTGSIGLSMARRVKELIGIEIIESAVECANENAKLNGFDNAHFFAGDAKDTKELLSRAESVLRRKINPDVIILDPPRAGLDDTLIQFVCSKEPRCIVYISCNPKTLARDVKKFIELGYRTDEVLPVDMFPGTGHVESVVCFKRYFDAYGGELLNEKN